MTAAGIRRARPEDAAALGAILSDWIDGTDWMPRLHTRDEDRAFVAGLIDRATVLALTLDGAPAGFLARQDTEIPAFYLAPAARGLGHGASMLARARAGCETLALWTFAANSGALRFYEANGFVRTGATEGDNEEGLADVRMTWWISGA